MRQTEIASRATIRSRAIPLPGVLFRWIGVLLIQATLVGSHAQLPSRTAVTVSGEVSAVMAFPSRTVPVVVAVNANAGADAGESLHGNGGHVGRAFGRDFIESSVYQLVSGAITGESVVLTGTIVESVAPALVGASVKIAADAVSGSIELTISSIERGPFASQTLHFVGAGSVVIKER